VEPARQRASEEVSALVEGAIAVMGRDGAEQLTVAEVLREAGLSTRAFYRHFTSKDELVLAVYERDAGATRERLRERMAAARSFRAALELWIDETLALGFDARRARRTRVLAREGARLQIDFPDEFATIVAGIVEPLADVLARLPSKDPERDAWSVYAVTWALVEEKLRGGTITRADAREHVLRFCLPALGLKP
jgi:AcrR family transcriptional regulator